MEPVYEVNKTKVKTKIMGVMHRTKSFYQIFESLAYVLCMSVGRK